MRTSILAAMAITISAFAVPAQARNGVELGLLDCEIAGGTGFVVGSNKALTCTFHPADKSLAPETYGGKIAKYGLDIGVTDRTIMQWLVLGPNADIYAPGSLAGNYVGGSAEATVAIGAGANVLIGGSGQTFTLQPVSLQTQTGVNLALGVTQFELRGSNLN